MADITTIAVVEVPDTSESVVSGLYNIYVMYILYDIIYHPDEQTSAVNFICGTDFAVF